MPGPVVFLVTEPARLLQSGLNLREGRVQLRADVRGDRDDRDRNTSGDEAVFDGRGARFVTDEVTKNH